MKIYSFLTGPDDASFCHRVTEYLSRGWELYGSPSITYDAQTTQLVCGQAFIKEVKDAEYSPDMDIFNL